MRLPWFRIYGDELLNDEKIKRLSNAQLGVLLKLWASASHNDGIPPDPKLQARIVGMRSADFRRISEGFLTDFFHPSKENPQILVSPRMEREAMQYEQKVEKLRNSGRKGGVASGKRRQANASKKRSEADAEAGGDACANCAHASPPSAPPSVASAQSAPATDAADGQPDEPAAEPFRHEQFWAMAWRCPKCKFAMSAPEVSAADADRPRICPGRSLKPNHAEGERCGARMEVVRRDPVELPSSRPPESAQVTTIDARRKRR
jgi:hypothetical protein